MNTTDAMGGGAGTSSDGLVMGNIKLAPGTPIQEMPLVVEKKRRGNPNFGKNKGMTKDGQRKPEGLQIAASSESTKSAVVYAESVIWTMFLQSTLQSWEARNEETVRRASIVADLALAEYKKRFK